MKSSLSSRPGDRAVAELARQRQPRRRRALARDLGLRRAARLARARRQDDARRRSPRPCVVLWFSQCSSAGRTIESTMAVTSGLFRRSFVWPWNCGSLMKMLSTPTTPSRMSSAVSVTPFGERLCVSMKLRIALPMPRAQAVLVRAARPRRDAVDVAAEVLVGRLGPPQHEVEPEARLVVLARERERRVVHRRRPSARRGSS